MPDKPKWDAGLEARLAANAISEMNPAADHITIELFATEPTIINIGWPHATELCALSDCRMLTDYSDGKVLRVGRDAVGKVSTSAGDFTVRLYGAFETTEGRPGGPLATMIEDILGQAARGEPLI